MCVHNLVAKQPWNLFKKLCIFCPQDASMEVKTSLFHCPSYDLPYGLKLFYKKNKNKIHIDVHYCGRVP